MSSEVFEAKLRVYDRFLATLTAIGVVAGGIWGVYSFFEVQDQDLKLRKQELAFTVFKEKKEAYLELIDAASEIAASRNREEVIENAPQFLKLVVGRAHIISVADTRLTEKKREFKDLLLAYLANEDMVELPYKHFSDAAFNLTFACQKHIDARNFDISDDGG